MPGGSGGSSARSFSPDWGSVASLTGGFLANRARRKESARNRAFQLMMSSTAHQREVRDLRLAGLNPILSATGGRGASTGSGAMAQQMDIVTPAVTTALAVRRLKQDIAVMKATEDKTIAEAERVRSMTRVIDTSIPFTSTARGVANWIKGRFDDPVDWSNMLEELKRSVTGAGESTAKGVQRFLRVPTPSSGKRMSAREYAKFLRERRK